MTASTETKKCAFYRKTPTWGTAYSPDQDSAPCFIATCGCGFEAVAETELEALVAYHNHGYPADMPLTPDTVAVGMGCTRAVGSDRYAGTIVWVSPSGKSLRFTGDQATPNGPVHDREQHDYSYETIAPTEEYPGTAARWMTRKGRSGFWVNGSLVIAGRHHYYDPSF